MSEKATTSREALLKAANHVRPALATQAYIPALTHIKFDGAYLTAFNDISAIKVRCKVAVDRCIPGESLIRALGTFGAEQVMFQSGKEADLIISAGRAKVRLPTLENTKFPFTWPRDDEGTEIAMSHDILKGVERCLVSVGNDTTHPPQMGVTLDADDAGKAVLFSTDNFSISRYQTKTKISLPGDVPIIMPRFFCEQLVALAKAFSEDEIVMVLHDGALQVDYGKAASLFSRIPVDIEPLDFPRVIQAQLKLDGLKNRLSIIPDSFDAALGRALLVLSAEADKATKISVDGDTLKMTSASSMGDADDSMKFEADTALEDSFHSDPALLARAAKSCALVGFTKTATILADADAQFVHIIAHCSQ